MEKCIYWVIYFLKNVFIEDKVRLGRIKVVRLGLHMERWLWPQSQGCPLEHHFDQIGCDVRWSWDTFWVLTRHRWDKLCQWPHTKVSIPSLILFGGTEYIPYMDLEQMLADPKKLGIVYAVSIFWYHKLVLTLTSWK